MAEEPGHATSEEQAEQRDESADERDVAAQARDVAAAERDRESRSRDEQVRANHRAEAVRLATAEDEEAREGWLLTAEDREALRSFLNRLHEYQAAVAADRRAAAEDRQAAAEDRKAAARDRELGDWARQQAAVESAERYPDPASPRGADPGAGDRGEPSSESGQLGARTELRLALRRATARESDALESAQHAAALASELASSERRVAQTMEGLYSKDDPTANERRLALAQDAAAGASLALQRGERLRALAERAKDHLERATLRTLLSHTATAFGELGRAERSIADALELLAAHEQGEPAADHHREATEAMEAATRALERAEEMHRLELATGQPTPGPESTSG